MREWGLPNHHDDMKHSSLMFIVRQVMQIQFTACHANSIHSLAPCHACSVMIRHALPLIAGLGTLFNLRRGALSNCLLQLLHQSRFSWTEPCQFLNAEGMALEVGHLLAAKNTGRWLNRTHTHHCRWKWDELSIGPGIRKTNQPFKPRVLLQSSFLLGPRSFQQYLNSSLSPSWKIGSARTSGWRVPDFQCEIEVKTTFIYFIHFIHFVHFVHFVSLRSFLLLQPSKG